MEERKFFLCEIGGKELSILTGVLGAAVAEGLSADEINLLGNFIVALGSSLLTIAASEQMGCPYKCGNKDSTNNSNNDNDTSSTPTEAKDSKTATPH